MRAKLTIVGGKASKSEVSLSLPTVIGRSRDADLTVAHPMISRRHCELHDVDGLLMVRDLGSLNGTFVQGQQISEAGLRPNDEFTVGPLTFRVDYEFVGEIASAPMVPAEQPAKERIAPPRAESHQPAPQPPASEAAPAQPQPVGKGDHTLPLPDDVETAAPNEGMSDFDAWASADSGQADEEKIEPAIPPPPPLPAQLQQRAAGETEPARPEASPKPDPASEGAVPSVSPDIGDGPADKHPPPLPREEAGANSVPMADLDEREIELADPTDARRTVPASELEEPPEREDSAPGPAAKPADVVPPDPPPSDPVPPSQPAQDQPDQAAWAQMRSEAINDLMAAQMGKGDGWQPDAEEEDLENGETPQNAPPPDAGSHRPAPPAGSDDDDLKRFLDGFQ